jgi:DNA (cytosine-5)-methyltransferase 1
MTKPLLLDLFSGAGGCAAGYAQAGFEVVGVDVHPQPRYPFAFVQADALDVLNMLLADDGLWHGYALDDFAAIHASPPCQEYSKSRYLRNATHATPRIREKLVTQVRTRLEATCLPWVMENVPGAPLPDALELCGSMFGLPIRRHRWFASSHYLYAPGPCQHTDGFYNVIGGKVRGYGTYASETLYLDSKGRSRRREGYYRSSVGYDAMGIDWPMTRREMSEAIPPAYTRWIGVQLMVVVKSGEAAS